MEEESKAVQEVAKTTGKTIDAAREAGGFIARFVSGSLEQGIGIFEDRLKYMRWERQLRLMRRAEDFLKQSGLSAPTQAVPLKLAVPLLQGATLEEDDDLQDRWAILLVNAANASFGIEIRRSYVNILEQLNTLEVQVLDTLYSLPFEQSQHAGIITAELPHSARIAQKKRDSFRSTV
ncbi:MAG: Abi-alpha family protein [Gallionella sp.]